MMMQLMAVEVSTIPGINEVICYYKTIILYRDRNNITGIMMMMTQRHSNMTWYIYIIYNNVYYYSSINTR